MDLRELAGLLPDAAARPAILAPYSQDAALQEKIAALRAQGEAVIVDLPGHESSRADLGCDRELQLRSDVWEVVKLN